MILILLFVCYINTHINYLTADGEHHSLVVRASTSTVGLFVVVVAVAITCSVAFLTNYSCIIIIIINVGFYVYVLSLPNIVTNVRLSCLK